MSLPQATVIHGKSEEILPTLSPASVDAIVTDPPYGLSFMGRDWDAAPPSEQIWQRALSVLKPGGHMLVFGGTRTFHRLGCAIENAGFQIRDCLMWLYGCSFPKSHNISKALDKAHPEKELGPVIATKVVCDSSKGGRPGFTGATHSPTFTRVKRVVEVREPASDEAKRWKGWGTALKPGWEPIFLVRKPCVGTVADNVRQFGTGGINIDGCRLPGDDPEGPMRWPANVMHDGSAEATAGMGAAARYFYSAKITAKDRGDGNNHPTVKPTGLMRWLCRLITPPGGTVLDPFTGSGSTGKAAILEGFHFTGIEQDPNYVTIARRRIDAELSEQRTW
ncbi:DNA-methyltransferase [Tuwongella immobilis]|uniref:Methyltransferase n=1 Tax=Tuwongella immobilis TaxID=692036 RepID=A0A6C2YP59_9BACT|nr:site-specific DNA-methyltransferase [Tuwongella immobilis]VIP03081.1 dna methylase : DNA methylase N-4/N-6 domain protein OS=Delftia sp. (strain Cs1-4) GN=DelCs14_2654 PE=4 SV=1: N6_N4_Mtase [Tuwongella immobilis]VTS03330.1 dna methylase : DNA methylase N-4/N-6 domain protein OS=Delftia sp. (strain Cs1-4) GN=DelCs14_2654 PE=4 SV=1: N6_N4_Mtase [Tuwongella immobilis]